MFKKIIPILLVTSLLLTACQLNEKETIQTPILRFMSHESFDVDAQLIAQFEQEHQVKIEFIKGSDARTVLNLAILNQENPLADLIFGIDNTLLSKAVNADILLAYSSPQLAHLAEMATSEDTKDLLTPVSYGDVCLNYDIKWLSLIHI